MIARGDRVSLIHVPGGHEGTVTQINISKGKRYANIKWDDGVKEFRVACAVLRIVPPELKWHPNEVERLRERL